MRAKYVVDSVTQRRDGLKSAKLLRIIPMERQEGLLVLSALEVTSMDDTVQALEIGREYYIDLVPVPEGGERDELKG